MTDLFEKSIQILELPKVLERLAGQATQEGKERCLAAAHDRPGRCPAGAG